MEPNTPVAQTNTVRPNTIGNINAPLLVVFIATLALGAWSFFFGANQEVLFPRDIPAKQNTAGAGSSINPLPSPQLIGGDQVILMGGTSALGNSLNDLHTSPDSVLWTQVLTDAANTTTRWQRRMDFEPLYFNNKIYVIGGVSTGVGGATNADLQKVWVSTDNGVTWTSTMNVPAGFGIRRVRGVVFQNKMWFFGGYNPTTGTFLKDIWNFDGTTWNNPGNMPAIWQGRVVRPVIYNGSLAMIGCTFCSGPAGVAYNYWSSLDGITWSLSGYITGGAAKSRQGTDPVVFKGQMYTFGGDKGVNGSPGLSYTDTLEWDLGAPWNWRSTPNNFPGLSFFRSYALDGVLYVSGGVNSATGVPNNQVWSSPDAYHWSPVATLATNPPLWEARSNHGVVVVPEPARPDLVVTDIAWTGKFGTAAGTQPIQRSAVDFDVWFDVTVQNRGTADAIINPAAPAFLLTVNSTPMAVSVAPLASTGQPTPYILPPGQSYTWRSIKTVVGNTLRTTPGSYSIKATADASNGIPESDENNNAFTQPTPLIIY